MSDIYFQSVGYNSVLLLNIPPDRRGLIHEADVARLKEFAEYRQKRSKTIEYSTEQLSGKHHKATSVLIQ